MICDFLLMWEVFYKWLVLFGVGFLVGVSGLVLLLLVVMLVVNLWIILFFIVNICFSG